MCQKVDTRCRNVSAVCPLTWTTPERPGVLAGAQILERFALNSTEGPASNRAYHVLLFQARRRTRSPASQIVTIWPRLNRADAFEGECYHG